MNAFIREIEEKHQSQEARIKAAHEQFPDVRREDWNTRVARRLAYDKSKPYESFDLSNAAEAPFRITFIIGTNRSGSTLLNGLLSGGKDTYPGLPDMHPLSDLMGSYYRLLFHYDDNHFDHYGSHERLRGIFARAMHDTVMSSFFNAGFKIGEKRHMVLKAANDFSLYIDRLPDIFGDNFKVVYTIRDPRACIASNKVYRQKTGKGDLVTELVPHIKKYYDGIHASQMFHDAERFFLVRYEDIARKDAQTYDALEAFLGFDVSREGFRDLGYAIDDKLPQYATGWGGKTHQESLEKYKRNLTPEEIDCIEYFFADYLKRYGY